MVIASNGGADVRPTGRSTCSGPRAQSSGSATDTLVVAARPASEQERERLWVMITATYGGYACGAH